MVPYKILSISLAVINFGLILIALLSPSWSAYYSNVDFLLIGLWTTCSNKFGCNLLASSDVSLSFTRALMVFAFLLSTLALVSTVPWDMIVTFNFPLLLNALATSILSIIAGVCALVSLVLFEIYIHERKVTVEQHIRKWGAYVTYASCVMFFVAGSYNYFAFKYSLWSHCTSSVPNADPGESGEVVKTRE